MRGLADGARILHDKIANLQLGLGHQVLTLCEAAASERRRHEIDGERAANERINDDGKSGATTKGARHPTKVTMQKLPCERQKKCCTMGATAADDDGGDHGEQRHDVKEAHRSARQHARDGGAAPAKGAWRLDALSIAHLSICGKL